MCMGRYIGLTSNFPIFPNTWLFNKSVHFWAREWYWHRNDHILVFLSKLTMLYLGPKVSGLFLCVWCKSGKWFVRPKETLFIRHLVFILNCLTFRSKSSVSLMDHIARYFGIVTLLCYTSTWYTFKQTIHDRSYMSVELLSWTGQCYL